MKLLTALFFALIVTVAHAQEKQTKSFRGAWESFTIDYVELTKVDGVEMVHLSLSAYEDNYFGEDPDSVEADFFYPVEILSEADYNLLDRSRGIFVSPIRSFKIMKLTKRLFAVNTVQSKQGASRGWHFCTEESHPRCENGMYYSYGPSVVTTVEVTLK